MKTRAQKQQDLEALTQQFQAATAGMLVGFSKMTVPKDQELRNRLREAGAEYAVVKNTIARRAVAGTPYEGAIEHFKGVTAIALSTGDPVSLSKAVSKFAKDNPEVFKFKAGVVEGRVVALAQVEAFASLPPKEELIAKLLYVINAQAQRLVTVLSAVPRNLAVVVKQIGEQKSGGDVQIVESKQEDEPVSEPTSSDEPVAELKNDGDEPISEPKSDGDEPTAELKSGSDEQAAELKTGGEPVAEQTDGGGEEAAS